MQTSEVSIKYESRVNVNKPAKNFYQVCKLNTNKSETPFTPNMASSYNHSSADLSAVTINYDCCSNSVNPQQKTTVRKNF